MFCLMPTSLHTLHVNNVNWGSWSLMILLGSPKCVNTCWIYSAAMPSALISSTHEIKIAALVQSWFSVKKKVRKSQKKKWLSVMKSQGKVCFLWLFLDFSWLKANFFNFSWLYFLQRMRFHQDWCGLRAWLCLPSCQYWGHILHPQPIVGPGDGSVHMQSGTTQQNRTWFKVEQIQSNLS